MTIKATESNAGIKTLTDYLDGLTVRATIEDLAAHLTALDVCANDVAEFAHFSEEHYRRNLMRSGPFYHLLVLCWRSGQRSPIHNHAGSTCGVRVLSGVATETLFEPSPCGLLRPTSTSDLTAGQVTATQDSNIHQVSNLQPAGTDLITLHIYSPPLLRMDTYSLTDNTVSEFRPVIFEHIHGSGI
ncbi:MAG: cysteine dioxygenase family protein [Phycisphaerae bacterium]